MEFYEKKSVFFVKYNMIKDEMLFKKETSF